MRSARLRNLPNRRNLVQQRRTAALTIYQRGHVRTLSFEPTDRRYDFIYQSCVYGDAPKDRTDAKVLGAVLDKLEAIGQMIPLKDDKDREREPKRNEVRLFETVAGGAVVLEEAEYDMVVRRMIATIPTTLPAFVRDMERALAWVESSPKRDAAEVAGSAGVPATVSEP